MFFVAGVDVDSFALGAQQIEALKFRNIRNREVRFSLLQRGDHGKKKKGKRKGKRPGVKNKRANGVWGTQAP